MARKKASKADSKKAAPRKKKSIRASLPSDPNERRFQIEDDMRTLSCAEEVRSTPARLRAVKQEIRRMFRVARGTSDG